MSVMPSAPTSTSPTRERVENNPLRLVLIALIIIFAVVGLGDSLYLTYGHYHQGALAVCGSSGGCNVVTSSEYSSVAGIPLAVLGVVFYLSVLFLAGLYRKKEERKILRVLAGWATLGFMMSAYLTYLQAFVIHTLCPLCLASAASSTLLFVSVLLLIKEDNNRKVAGV
jgi:uncharacterized membrane protein